MGVLLALSSAIVMIPAPATPVAVAAAPNCAASTNSVDLSEFFASAGSGLVGGDYPHSYPLPDGRVLWLFQDSFLGPSESTRLDQAGFAHNVALVQTGLCFEPRWGGGPPEAPQSYLGGTLESDLFHWWWPLDGEIGADGNLHVFAAEFQNPNGTGAAFGAEPIAVWRAVIDPADLAVLSFAPAADASERPLYGFSIASDDTWSYLYGNCYRQFTEVAFSGWFDLSCTTHNRIARVPKGHFEDTPEYWDGSDWVANRAEAALVHEDGLMSDPLQVARLADGRFVAVSHLDDWFGSAIVAYVAPLATGPFTQYARIPVASSCGPQCNTYFAGFTPWRTPSGSFEIAMSNFTWDFDLANIRPWWYRPTVVSVPSPDESADPVPVAIGADGTVALPVAGRLGVDREASSVALTLIATGPVATGYVTVWACGTPRPVASSVNLLPYATVGNTVIAPIGVDGTVCLWSSSAVSLIVDVQGWTTSRSDHRRVSPARLLDTRPGFPTVDGIGSGPGVLRPGVVLQVPAVGRAGVAATSRQVTVNLTVVGARSAGYVTVWDCGAQPATSSINVVVGHATSNLALVGLSPQGTLCATSSVPTHLMIDVQGWWSGRSELMAVPPARIIDSRPGATTIDGYGLVGKPLGAGEVLYVPVAARNGVGLGEAVVLDIVALHADKAGYLTAWPCSATQPSTSTVNFQAGSARATLAIVPLTSDGWVCVASGGATRVDVVIDVTGWFPAEGGGYEPLVPSRALDTRNR
jgi:hypothetical protein